MIGALLFFHILSAVVWVGGSSVMHGQKSASEFFSFITAMALFSNPVKRLIGSYNSMQRAIGAADRVFEIIDQDHVSPASRLTPIAT